MAEPTTAEAALAQLLLLQTAIHAAPDERRLCEMVAHVVGQLPGTTGAAVCLEGVRVGSGAAAGLLACAPGATCGTASCAPAVAAGRGAAVPIQTTRRTLGAIVLDGDAAQLARYLAMVRNVATLVAFRIENERQGAALAQLASELERRVQERTAALEAEKERAGARAAELQTVLDAVPAAVFITRDRRALAMTPNRFCAELFRVSQAANVSKSAGDGAAPTGFRILVDGAEVPPERLPVQVAAREGIEVRDCAFDVEFEDGATRALVGNAAPLRDPGGEVTGAVGAFVDVTEQRRFEAQFRQAQKLESVGRLAGGVAHDFNNLLTVILSSAEHLRGRLGDGTPDDVKEDVEAICAAGDRARGVTSQLLAFARRQAAAPVAVDLGAAVRGLQKMIGRLLGEDIRVRTELARDLWSVYADPGQIDQILVNVVVNARDAMPAGGELRLSTRNRTVGAGEVQGGGVPAGEWVQLTIRDTGTGMTPETKAHLFEPFYTTKERGKGTGLGLATVWGIVKQAGGHVHVESDLGAGTSFHFWFPRHAAGAGRPAAPGAAAAAAPGGGERILVVEDDPQVLAVTLRTLRASGYDAVGEADPQRALDLVAASGATGLRLLLTDVVMPSMSGRALAAALRRTQPDLRVLYVSGYPGDVLAGHGVESPLDLIAKPFTGPALLARVRAALDRPDAPTATRAR